MIYSSPGGAASPALLAEALAADAGSAAVLEGPAAADGKTFMIDSVAFLLDPPPRPPPSPRPPPLPPEPLPPFPS